MNIPENTKLDILYIAGEVKSVHFRFFVLKPPITMGNKPTLFYTIREA
ncbi:hypothetical protein VCRA2126O85_140107 [Vibrio crassostreae]|nr:hypothetical protein VCRA2126O86_130107 [Vibrio crassostreae]CAK2628697.1 hypothetical protein VCRA2125O83_140012 [Vibrio crassostreae]CAK2637395.1 hypothetical protein VCRA2127O91_140108 [Vibrio crassostreae]CAK2637908.1 hypothetical protein VCRA2126O85_140107 [Vibrio crassostreae]CAK2637991.1 hypothetical protein VCRA2128O106_140107 [Vibrio crassostreae]